MFLYIATSILLSTLAIQLKTISPKIAYNIITPILVWVISLMSLQVFTIFSPYGLFGSIISGILLWKIVYNWILFIAKKSENENLESLLKKFDETLNAPWKALILLWNTFYGFVKIILNSIKKTWQFITNTWNNLILTIKTTWEKIEDIGNALVGIIENNLKALFNAIVDILENIVSLGGLIKDEDVLPPVPSKFEQSDIDNKYLTNNIPELLSKLY